MKLVNIRAHPGVFFHDGRNAKMEQVEALLADLMFNSAPKNIGRELLRRGDIESFEEWRFWGFPTKKLTFHGLPLWLFNSPDGVAMTDLENRIVADGQPDVIWAEGIHFPVTLSSVFELCPDSIKIIYPKYCEPWLIERLDLYDVCLVDEEWQVEEMRRRQPTVRCRVWDKLVDYEEYFYPMGVPKKYDICYVARIHKRKNHWLLFDSLAMLKDRKLSVVLIGSNANECQQFLEPLAEDSGVDATFTGHVPADAVNQRINESKMGVICDKYDAVPRAMLEYMAADVPVLVNADMRAGIRYVGAKAGLIRSPADFADGIVEILDDTSCFCPREHLLANYSKGQVADKMHKILKDVMLERAEAAVL